MYQCIHCGNKKEFIENYTEEVHVYISEEGDFCHSEPDKKLIEIVCCNCNHSTEDGDMCIEGKIINF